MYIENVAVPKKVHLMCQQGKSGGLSAFVVQEDSDCHLQKRNRKSCILRMMNRIPNALLWMNYLIKTNYLLQMELAIIELLNTAQLIGFFARESYAYMYLNCWQFSGREILSSLLG